MGYIIIQVWARCMRYAVLSHVHVPCVLRYTFLKHTHTNTQAAGPNSLGATSSLKTRVRPPASVPFPFFPPLLVFLFLFPHLSSQCWCYSLKYSTCQVLSSELHGSPQFLPSLCRERFEEYSYHHPSLGRTCRVITSACAVCSESRFFFFKK